MNSKNLSNISFSWASIVFGTIGMGLLEKENYSLGTGFIVLSLVILAVREKLKIN